MDQKKLKIYRNRTRDNVNGEEQLVGTIYASFHPRGDELQGFGGDRVSQHNVTYEFFTSDTLELRVNDRAVDVAGNKYRIEGVVVYDDIEYSQQGLMVTSL